MGNTHSKVIECSCGAIITGSSDADIVAKAQRHAKETHDMELSWEQAMSLARPA
jgi:predicted small metal-binding protein